MLKRKYIIVTVLAIIPILFGSLLYASITRAQIRAPTGSTYEYDPWVDINDDGVIDIFDLVLVANHYGYEGTPITKAGLLFDSGWVNITKKAGQYFNITHNLNSTDIIVDITGKTTVDGGIHQRNFGGTWYVAGWSRTCGGAGNDMAYSVVQTSDGGYAMAGATVSFGAGAGDFWLVKTDVFGHEQWSHTYGGASDDVAYSVVQTSDGGYALAGYTQSFGAGSYDFWLVKTDAFGHEQWSHTYGGANFETAYSLVQTDDDGYAIAGYISSSDVQDFWLVKTDAAGNMEWNKTYGGAAYDWCNSLVQTSDGGYALAGVWSWGDFWLVKTNETGHEQWNQTYGATAHEEAFSVVQTSDGGYALAGHTETFLGGYDFWLVKTGGTGHEQWSHTYGGTWDDVAYSVVQTSDGGYALAGYTEILPIGGYDFWLVKTGGTGHEQWNQAYGGTNYDEAMSVVQTSDGGYAIAGFTYSFGAGGYDFWLVKTGVESGLVWTDSTSDTITLYRGGTDPYWNYVRVRIWKIKETP